MSKNTKKIAEALYDFAVDGGAAGTITPQSNAIVPKGAIITKAWTEGASLAKTSSGTFALAVGGVTIKSATAIDSNDFIGLDIQLASTTLNKTTSSGRVTVTIAGGTCTAGTLKIFVEYTV